MSCFRFPLDKGRVNSRGESGADAKFAVDYFAAFDLTAVIYSLAVILQ